MTIADFEESEYRGPLYNQLERGNHLVWEPGQVFEKHIGIDRAAYVTDPYFWGLHGRMGPMGGAILVDYNWDYIWKNRIKYKVLPDFQLNLFLQAKRPHAGTRPRGRVREEGITSHYWKFDITKHQQVALENVSRNLDGKALVCYAAPAFHTQAELYTHTKDQSIVPNSTFPLVSELAGHGAWYYDRGGCFGVANPDFERIAVEPLLDRIRRFLEASQRHEHDAVRSLKQLAEGIVDAHKERDETTSLDTWFQFLLDRGESIVAELRELGGRDEEQISALRSYAQVRAFCHAYHLDWYVLGRGG
ncbi:hypothetical protein GJQ57_18670 [Ralstonia pickettii]|uniref:Uncharacterized protein n=1 Tax=Ralstonia pickettii TaxID=329 RepID=A0A7X2LC94_RALPI|nr:hypothetical protein [Ralstonia pickettii]MRT00671.1 hypothetical protein [Ralstonia pickettii]